MNANASFSDMYGSRYVSAEDLGGREPTVTISKAYQEMLTDRQNNQTKPRIIIMFKDKTKGLVLNKTNAKTLALGTQTEDWNQWVGTRVVLYTVPTQMGDGVRLRIAQLPAKKTPAPAMAAADAAAEHYEAARNARDDMSDEVPF